MPKHTSTNPSFVFKEEPVGLPFCRWQASRETSLLRGLNRDGDESRSGDSELGSADAISRAIVVGALVGDGLVAGGEWAQGTGGGCCGA